MPFRKGNPELKAAMQDALDSMMEDGTYLEIANEWVGRRHPLIQRLQGPPAGSAALVFRQLKRAYQTGTGSVRRTQSFGQGQVGVRPFDARRTA